MEYICPYCGNQIKSGLYCNKCSSKIDSFQKIWRKSNFYYNKGLAAAKRRELSLAQAYLQKAVLLYKYNIEARNLLGLVYLEVGQVGQALKEWIVSQSLFKEDNKASSYIKSIQEEPRFLETSKEGINLYNKALMYLNQGNMDMAIIRLKKSTSLLPQFVEARGLLALCYMKQKQFYKAKEQVKRILAIDCGHKQALAYFKQLSGEDTESVKPYELEYQNKTVKTSNVDKFLNRSIYLRRGILNFVLGVVATIIVCNYLFLPNKIKVYEDKTLQLKESETSLVQQIDSLTNNYKSQITQLETNNKKLEDEIKQYETQVMQLTQKERMASARQMVNERAYVEAAKIIYSIAATSLSAEDSTSLSELKDAVYPRAREELYNQGVNFYNQKNYVDANAQFETLLLYGPDEWTARKTLFYLGEICEINEDTVTAKQYYEKIVAEYPDTREASRASERIETMSEETTANAY